MGYNTSFYFSISYDLHSLENKVSSLTIGSDISKQIDMASISAAEHELYSNVTEINHVICDIRRSIYRIKQGKKLKE